MNKLPARDAYRIWAPTYASESAVSYLEDQIARSLGPEPAGLRLLDVGCGIGRRMQASGAAFAVGLDLAPAMLSQALGGALVAADARALPCESDSFDVVWCRLVMGHVADPAPVYEELARVCKPHGSILVTDFHPDAASAGHRRTFRDSGGALHEVEHYVHQTEHHARLAKAFGLELVEHRDGEVGPGIRDFYERSNRLEMYDAQVGLKLVLALLFRRVR
jgi:ubiquinone/menaquinone biosynthesis C-methylase UbiE